MIRNFKCDMAGAGGAPCNPSLGRPEFLGWLEDGSPEGTFYSFSDQTPTAFKRVLNLSQLEGPASFFTLFKDLTGTFCNDLSWCSWKGYLIQFLFKGYIN